MSDALYERYKDALRRGHVAALRGRYDAALEAYGQASRIAPDRPVPFVGVANVLSKLGRSADALAAFDAALDRAPGDESALRGRADLLVATEDRVRAAATLDRLAESLDRAGRLPEATDAARRSLELAESRARRATVRALVDRLRDRVGEPAAAEALAAALPVLEGPAIGPADEDGPPDEPEPEPEAFLPGPATAAVEDALAAGDAGAARDLALVAAGGHRTNGATAAAIDACYLALAGTPADPALHLALVDLYLDRGWRTTAVDKLVLLARLAELTDDVETRKRVCAIAADRLPEEPRLAEFCA